MAIHSVIQNAIKNCNLVFFVGAGFSQPLGLPNWTGLVKIITDDLKKDYPGDAFISSVVEMIKQGHFTEIEALDKLRPKHLRRILDLLEEHIDIDLSSQNLDRHKKLWQITDQIITTNYDKALETVLPAKADKVVYEDDFHVAKLSDMERFLYKAHGCIEHPGKCVLFSVQYKKLYEEQTGPTLELFRLLADKTIIFLGFSLNDPFVNELLTLRQKAYNGFKANHFIITTDKQEFTSFGVEKITCINNYSEDLDSYLDELAAIRQEYPYGLAMLIRGLKKDGVDFNEDMVRKTYFDYIVSLEKKPETANIAETINAGEFENAEDKLKKELQEEMQTLHKSKENAAVKAFELAKLKQVQLKYHDALPYYRQAVELQPTNPQYYNELGYALVILGKPKESITYYEKALTIAIENYGNSHFAVATVKNNIGQAWDHLGEYTKAIEFYEDALNIDLKNYEEKHPKIAIRKNNIGSAWNKLGEHTKAIKYFEDALKIDLEVHGDKHPDTAIDYNNIGLAWKKLGEYTKAIKYYEDALNIDLENFGKNHPKVAIRMNNIGSALNDLGEYTKAIEYYKDALKIDLEVYGEKHPKIATRKNNIGYAWQCLGNYPKAIEYYIEALTILSEMLGDEHPYTKEATKNLQSARNALNNNNP